MQSKAKTVQQYLAQLPPDRREAIEAVRATILKNLPKGYEEGMQYGMIGYFVPHDLYPAGYHCNPQEPVPFVSLASQKHHISVYLMCVYGNAEQEAWFREAWAKTGKKLDMGKSCVRFKRLEDVPLKVIGQAVRRVPVAKFLAQYEACLSELGTGRATQAAPKKKVKKATAKKRAAKKTARSPSASKQAATKKKTSARARRKTAAAK